MSWPCRVAFEDDATRCDATPADAGRRLRRRRRRRETSFETKDPRSNSADSNRHFTNRSPNSIAIITSTFVIFFQQNRARCYDGPGFNRPPEHLFSCCKSAMRCMCSKCLTRTRYRRPLPAALELQQPRSRCSSSSLFRNSSRCPGTNCANYSDTVHGSGRTTRRGNLKNVQNRLRSRLRRATMRAMLAFARSCQTRCSASIRDALDSGAECAAMLGAKSTPALT